MIDLDRLFPGEGHLFPSQRRWAREIQTRHGQVLELRDPNDGIGGDPAEKTRYQYLVARGYLWRRQLPPAPLEQPEDETPFRDSPLCWEVSELAAHSPITAWALAQDPALRRPSTTPEEVVGERNPDGTGWRDYRIYRMPPRSPRDMWGDITSYAGQPPVPCPVAGCDQHLVWDEAGRVPGARSCMRSVRDDAYDVDSCRHRFVLDHAREWHGVALILYDEVDL